MEDGLWRCSLYYSCGLFKNKGSSACSTNSVRADEAEEYVFNRIKDVILNERVLKDIVANLNTTRVEVIKSLEEEKKFVDRQIESHMVKKKRVFDLYEDGHLPKEMLTERLKEIEITLEQMEARKLDIIDKIKMNSSYEIPFDLVKETMEDFNKLLNSADQD